MQVAQRAHSGFSMLIVWAMASTGRLIGQPSVHVWQFLHERGSALSLSEGHWIIFLKLLPKIIQGAIQQI